MDSLTERLIKEYEEVEMINKRIIRGLDYIFDNVSSNIIDIMEECGEELSEENIKRYTILALKAKIEEVENDK